MRTTSRHLAAAAMAAGLTALMALGAEARIVSADTPNNDIAYIIVDDAVALAQIGGATEIIITPTFTVPAGMTVFGNVQTNTTAISSFATDGSSFLDLFAATPFLVVTIPIQLADITPDLSILSLARAPGAFLFTEIGPNGSFTGVVQRVDEPSSLLVAIAGLLALLAAYRHSRREVGSIADGSACASGAMVAG